MPWARSAGHLINRLALPYHASQAWPDIRILGICFHQPDFIVWWHTGSVWNNSKQFILDIRINPIRPIYTGFYYVRVNWMIRASVPKYCVVSYQISGNQMILFLSNSYDNIYWILCFYPANFGLHIRDNPTITIPSMPQQTNSKGYFTALFSKEVHLSCNFHIINIILKQWPYILLY